MGKLTEALVEIIKRQVADRGIVVWYDPQKAYTGLAQRLELPGTTILRYENGFFRLREQLEPLLECVTDSGNLRPEAEQPPAVILYVPMAREDCGHALIEAETAGVVLEPHATQPDCNTRLGWIAEQIFSKIAPAKAAHLARQADEGLLTLEELDRMAEDAGARATGTLQVIFDHASAEEIILQFLASEARDAAIEDKKALADLEAFLRDEVGLNAGACSSPKEVRTKLLRYMLTADLLLQIPRDAIPEALQRLPIPEKPVQQDLTRHVCKVWRNRADLKEGYSHSAQEVEKAINLPNVKLPMEHLQANETFPWIERLWLREASQLMLEGKGKEALEIAGKRALLFWANENPAYQLEWRVVETAAKVFLEADRIRGELKKRKLTLDEMVRAYARHAEPWMELDRVARSLDSRYARVEFVDSGEEGLEKVVVRARQLYGDTLHTLASAYAAAASEAEFTSKHFRKQQDVYKSFVRPAIEKGLKTAYFLVDGLRYEMGCELMEGLTAVFEAQVEPILGQLPGITCVGMAALMPGAEQGLSLEKKGADLAVAVAGQLLTSRQERMVWIKEKSGVPTAVFKLGEVTKFPPKKKKEIDAAQLVIVTSQEIDKLGEEAGDEEEARVYMEQVLEKVRRAMRTLARAGVRQFVITADHGFHLLDSIDPGLSMDSPGGDTTELHPRVWIGKGGAAADGYLRVKSSDLELGGTFEFAFPRGLGTFKVKGGVNPYFHGGISPQEHILPVILVKVVKTLAGAKGDVGFKLSLARPTITNRIFSVTVTAENKGLFPAGPRRVRVEVLAGKAVIGQAVVASYGYEESTREIEVVPGRPNAVTVMLGHGEVPKAVTIHLVDCENQLVLDSVKDIPVKLGI